MIKALLHIELERGCFADTGSNNAKCYLVDDIERQDEYARESIINMVEQMEEESIGRFAGSNRKETFILYTHCRK